MNREAMIDLLVLDGLERATMASRTLWLMGMLRDGFAGFANMSDESLAREFSLRGLQAIEDDLRLGLEEENLPGDMDLIGDEVYFSLGNTGHLGETDI